MTTAAHFLWSLGGRPGHGRTEVDTPPGAVCLCCGDPIATATCARATHALGVNYDFTRAARRDSPVVDPACAWALAGRGLATLRLWTIAATTGRALPASHPKCTVDLGPQVHLTNRADMRAVAALLTDPPEGEWLVTVAMSGQKHVVPYSRTNRGAGRWTVRVENFDVTSDPVEFAALLARVAALRHAGFGPDQIAAVDPGTHLSTRSRLDAWRLHAEPLTPYRGSPLLGLAATTPNKEHLDDYLASYPLLRAVV